MLHVPPNVPPNVLKALHKGKGISTSMLNPRFRLHCFPYHYRLSYVGDLDCATLARVSLFF